MWKNVQLQFKIERMLNSNILTDFNLGMRLGAHAMTSRGFKEAEFKTVVELVDKAIMIGKEAQAKTKTVKDYVGFLATDPEINEKCQALKDEVNEFALKYPMPGFDGH